MTASPIKSFFSCSCGFLVPAAQARVECPGCGQKWRKTPSSNRYEAVGAVKYVCPNCGGLAIHVSLSQALTPPALERCAMCGEFSSDDDAADAVAEAWKSMRGAAEQVVDRCQVCPFINDSSEYCNLFAFGTARYELGNIQQVDPRCPLREKIWLVRLSDKVEELEASQNNPTQERGCNAGECMRRRS